MNKGLSARLNKLEGAKEAGRLAIVCARFPWELAEAEAEKARLEAEGRRVIMVRWQWDEGEHGAERVCGDSAVFAARSPEWAINTFGKAGVASLAVMAARLLDESEGRFLWNYQFAPFGPSQRFGYDVFACSEDLDEAPPGCFRDVSNVLCRCFYMGFVLCLKPVIPFGFMRRGPTTDASSHRQPASEQAGPSRAKQRASG